MTLSILFIAACFLAFSNGANDNFKGVATLFGSGTTDYKKAINWATLTTLAGSIAAVFLAEELVKNFSGKGLVPQELIQTPIFAISIAMGAAITVYIATKIGMPISTTHSLVGALFGTGVIAVGSEFNFQKLGNTFLMPLIASPLIAAILSLVCYFILHSGRKICRITTEENEGAITTYQGNFLSLSIQKIVDFFHYISSGVVSFARGLNDTPKIVGLLLIIKVLDIQWSMIAIAVTMAIGGLAKAKKVGETMSKKITPMNAGQGLTANMITGLLVTTASIHGLPVSTTHVSVGAIFGIGTLTKKADLKTISKIVLSWVLTLPIAALLSGSLFLLLRMICY
ncbi:inorganic phosphate transporter [Aquimarina sp. TRL1]|uniref:inorganic phosphate transporter n=1 Tax=Aquimarina sp. (strain TRL1) TaxID=2736252 RepID=UPI00158A0359|nr:inorganic phosphate transporter [Aquimarina sp. TRL1]QKX04278.1 inorganic phosphate transporter [Aquimarina sp. TRL1]